eukprot:TRINITY_DN942_c0_g1_i3.p1 TRINITY_DN942_c0_g1~~TRINITY_DN942_c0_g1_i3.p1  ORF type:complete len:162 (-),score=4.75 TRINITY_DN942_c0_g1_i3:16-501(-)
MAGRMVSMTVPWGIKPKAAEGDAGRPIICLVFGEDLAAHPFHWFQLVQLGDAACTVAKWPVASTAAQKGLPDVDGHVLRVEDVAQEAVVARCTTEGEEHLSPSYHLTKFDVSSQAHALACRGSQCPVCPERFSPRGRPDPNDSKNENTDDIITSLEANVPQ